MFSHTTRFFIVVEDKEKILKPILSRFCEIYVNHPRIGTRYVNLHKHLIKHYFSVGNEYKNLNWIEKNVKFGEENENYYLIKSEEAYNNGISALDIIQYIEKRHMNMDSKTNKEEIDVYRLLMYFDKIKQQFRNEKNLIFFVFVYGFMRHNHSLENVMSI
jgi:DNA polymerase III delta prime subunit